MDSLLDEDFDPEAWDKQMAEAFDDDYYEVCVCVGGGGPSGGKELRHPLGVSVSAGRVVAQMLGAFGEPKDQPGLDPADCRYDSRTSK